MDKSNPVKVNASVGVNLHSKDLPEMIKAFETMDIGKVKLLCGTAIVISLIVTIGVAVSVAFIMEGIVKALG